MRWIAFGLLAVFVGRVAADPPSGGGLDGEATHVAAVAAQAAVKAKDRAALKAVALRTGVDPWLVADELEGLEGVLVARAYAAEVATSQGERLRKHLESRVQSTSSLARDVLVDASKFLADGKPESALRVLQSLKGEDSRGAPILAVRVHLALAAAHAAYGETVEGAAEQETAARTAESIGWLEKASTLFRESGQTAYEGYDYSHARQRWQSRLRILRLLGRNDELGAVLNNVASACGNGGDLAAALSYYREAVAAFLRQGSELNGALALQNLGQIEADVGQYAQALSTEDRASDMAEAVAKRSPGDDALRGVRAQIAFTLGGLELELGRTRDALNRFKSVLATLGSHSDDGELLAMTYGNIGVAHVNLGEFDQAERAYESALDYFEKHKDSARIAQSLANLADLLVRVGKTEKALRYQEAAVKRLQEIGDPLELWHAKGEAATYLRKSGDSVKALEGHLEALRAAESLGAKALLARQWSGVAGDKYEGKDFQGAVEAARKTIEEMGGVVGGLADLEGISARETFSDVFVVGARAAARLNDPTAADQFLEAGRAGTLLEAMGGRDKMWSAVIPPALADTEQRLRALERDAIADWVSAVVDGDLRKIEAKRKALDDARNEVRSVVSRIQREAKRGAMLVYPTVDSAAEIMAALDPAEVLVTYGCFEEESMAVVLRKSAPARIVALPKAAEIERLVSKVLPTAGDSLSTSELEALRAALIEPLGLSISDRRVLVSPDGPLANLPPALLFEDRDVAYVPSGTVLRFLRSDALPAGKGVLGFGDPDYRSRGASPRIRDLRDTLSLVALKETRAEVETVADTRFLGDQATESALRRALTAAPGRLRALHFAAHGILDREQPLRSSIALTVEGEDDGLLTGLEILRMRIPADAVVLSACRTGVGAVVRGEGAVGLTRCFLFAGAPRVIASAWKVDDAATKELMVHFYGLWKAGKTPASAALRSAQTWVRDMPGKNWRDPRFWAAWTLWGLPE